MASFTVLIVDDYEPFLQVLRLILPSGRFQVVAQACDGLEALKKAELLQPDLILLDIGLPRLNGIEVAKTLKSIAPHTAVLMLSQDASPEVVEEALNAGALGYVHKQLAQRELLAGIESVLAGKRFVSYGMLDHDLDAQPTPQQYSHRVLYYSDDSDLLAGLSRFITAALRANSPVMSILTQVHRDWLIRHLREGGVDIDRVISQGYCVWFDADGPITETQITGAIQRLVDAATQLSSSRPPRVAVCGERAARLCAEGKTQEALALELFADRLARRFGLDILCAYPASQSQSLDAQRASLIHSLVHAA